MSEHTHTCRRGEDAASSAEYGILAAGVAAMVVIVVFLLGGAVSSSYGDSCGKIATQVQSTC